MRLNILLNQNSDFLNRMMMIEKLENQQEESSDHRKEQAYKKHLQRLIKYLSNTPDQSETENEKFEPGTEEKKTATQEE